MKLPEIMPSLNAGIAAVKGRAEANWKNMSTTAKVASIGATAALVGAAIAASILGAGHIAAITGLSAGASAAVFYSTAIGGSVLGTAVPSLSLLRKPSKKKPAEIELAALKNESATSAEESSLKPSRLAEFQKASLQFVRNHPRIVVAGSVLALGALGVGLMGAQRRANVANLSRSLASNVRTLSGQAVSKGFNVINAVSSKATTVANGLKGRIFKKTA